MGVLHLAEAKGARQGVDRGDGRADRPALLEAYVPVDANAREFGHFLAAQAWRATPAAGREAGGAGSKSFPARAQEVAQFVAAAIGHSCSVLREGFLIPG
jgi:hypothetical protein